MDQFEHDGRGRVRVEHLACRLGHHRVHDLEPDAHGRSFVVRDDAEELEVEDVEVGHARSGDCYLLKQGLAEDSNGDCLNLLE